MYSLSGIMLDIQKKEKMAGGERITLYGNLTLEGRDIMDMKPSDRARAGIVLCPERRRLFSESSVLENLRIGGYLATREQARVSLEFVMALFPALTRMQKRLAGFLSGGEQQMVAIGRALMAQPKVLLLDEPLMGLSPLIQATLIKAIKKIQKESDISIIVSEQYARPVFPIVDYAYILENGAAVMEGTRDELMNNPDVKSAYFGVS